MATFLVVPVKKSLLKYYKIKMYLLCNITMVTSWLLLCPHMVTYWLEVLCIIRIV